MNDDKDNKDTHIDGLYQRDVTPLLKHLSYVSFA